MSTLSTNQIVVEYIIREGDVKKAKDGFDKLTQAEKDAITNAQKLNNTLRTTGTEGKRSTDQVAGGLNNVGGAASKLGPLIAKAFSVAAVIAFGKQVFDTTAKFQQYQKVLDFTSGSQKQGAISMQFLKDTSDRLGISLIAAVEGFKTLSGAASQAGLTNNQTREVFENVAKSVAAFGLSSEDAKGVFLALGQIISKGTVQAEELRGQIGERIPGAFAIAARSIGVTERELNKMLQTGQVTAKDFIIPFTKELAKAASAADGPDGLTQKVNRISNAFEILKTRIGRGLLGETALVGNLLEKALLYANKLLSNEGDNQIILDTKAYEKATRDAADATDEALKSSIANSNAKIRKLKEEFDLLNERIAYDGELSKEEEKQLNRQRQLILQQQAYRNGLFDALKARKQTATETIDLTDKEKKAIADAAKKKQKALDDEYKRKVELLELDKQITAEKIKQTVGADGQKIAMMELEFATNLKLLKLSEEYQKVKTKQGTFEVKEAKDKAKLLPEIVKTQNVEITQEYIDAAIRDRETRVKGEDEVQQGIYEAKLKAIERNKMIQEASIQSEVLTDSQQKEKLILNEIAANDEIIKANDEAANNGVESALDANAKILADNAKLYKELKDLRKNDEDDQKKKDVERVQAASQVASAVLDGFMNLMQQQTQNELTALNKRYDAELRLAGDNEQKVMEINEKRKQEEKELRTKEFEAQRAAAIAQVVFKTAPIIAEYFVSGFLAPLAIAGLATAAAQIAFIAAQPVPEFKEGTKGKPFKGGKAIVGEIGKEWVVTTSGQVYETPGVATLVDLPKGSQVIPHHEVIKSERFMGSKLMNQGRGESGTGQLVERLISIENTLSKLPITSLTMDERGFTKKIQTKSRETRILNNRFGN
jgi:tape measure domain-containing protein